MTDDLAWAVVLTATTHEAAEQITWALGIETAEIVPWPLGVTLTREEASIALDLVRGNLAGTEEWWLKHANQKLDAAKAAQELAILRALAARLEAAQR